MFCGGISEPTAVSDKTSDRRHVDDSSVLSVLKMRHERSAHQVHAFQVYCDDSVPEILVGIQKHVAVVKYPSVVDQSGHLPEIGDDGLSRLIHSRCAANLHCVVLGVSTR